MGYGATDPTDRVRKRSNMGFDSDENTEAFSQGEEGIAVETMGKEPVWGNSAKQPKPQGEGKGQPTGNPQDYVSDNPTADGVPFDEPNSEHLSASNEKLLSILREYGLDPIEAGMDHDGAFATFHGQEDAHKARDLFKRAGYGESEIVYSVDRGYRTQTKGKKLAVGEGFDPKGASLKGGKSKLEDYDSVKEKDMHGDANEQEPGKERNSLLSVVEHEGHSVGIHAGDGGFVVRGKGSAGYIQSEPISDRSHAEEYAKEMLKAHAKLTEREVVAKMSNHLGAEGDERLDWGSVSAKEKRNMWDSLTRGATHKISACMNKVDGHVDNPGAYCKSLADEVGYKPM
jgi:hypothetical protein